MLPTYVVVCRILVYDQKQSTDRQGGNDGKKRVFRCPYCTGVCPWFRIILSGRVCLAGYPGPAE